MIGVGTEEGELLGNIDCITLGETLEGLVVGNTVGREDGILVDGELGEVVGEVVVRVLGTIVRLDVGLVELPSTGWVVGAIDKVGITEKTAVGGRVTRSEGKVVGIVVGTPVGLKQLKVEYNPPPVPDTATNKTLFVPPELSDAILTRLLVAAGGAFVEVKAVQLLAVAGVELV